MPVVWSVREARFPDEVEIVRALFREYEAQVGESLCFQGFEEELETLPGKYRGPKGIIVLAFLDKQPVGCAALRPLQPRVCEMKRLYVQPAARGRGIARALVRRLFREARGMNYKTMKLDTLERMEGAVALYESMGFVRTEPYVENPFSDAVFMERQI